jgi:hypothetical protein
MEYRMTRHDRLERWATVLEHAKLANLAPFRDVELLPPGERDGLRIANSPLSLAYNDPVLRRAGLGSDRFGAGAAFFGLSRYQAHRVLCSCGYFGTMRASEVARRIRRLAARDRLRDLLPKNPLPAFARWLSRVGPAAAAYRG